MKLASILNFLLIMGCSLLPQSRSDLRIFTSLSMQEQIRPFLSDGCSYWPDGTKDQPRLWLHCCVDHDLAYWLGGSAKARKKADQNFKSCIHKTNYHAADVMYLGVRFFGRPSLKSSYRWGYGWTYNRGYIKLDQKEKDYIKNILPKKGELLTKYIRSSPYQNLKLRFINKFNLNTYDQN